MWSRISFHLAKYFKAIQQNSTALQLYNRSLELGQEPGMAEQVKTDITLIEKIMRGEHNLDNEEDSKMDIDTDLPTSSDPQTLFK